MRRKKVQVAPDGPLPLVAENWTGTNRELIAAYRAFLGKTQDMESRLRLLRQSGHGKGDSMFVLAVLKIATLGEAKLIVHLSETWKDMQKPDERFHEKLIKMVKEIPGVTVRESEGRVIVDMQVKGRRD